MTVKEILSQTHQPQHFRQDPVDVEVLERLLDQSRQIPTAFNLQPSHFYVVTDATLKQKMTKACLHQGIVRDAPALIVFSASRYVIQEQFEEILDEGLESGTLSVEKAESIENSVKMLFDIKPCGLGLIAKWLLAPILRLFTVLPRLPAVHKSQWLTEQVMRVATSFWFRANEENLAAVWVDIYDEWRVKRALHIPWHHVVVCVMAVGSPADRVQKASLLPLERLLHWNRWD